MKAVLVLFALCAVFATTSCLPAPEEVAEQQPSTQVPLPWYNPSEFIQTFMYIYILFIIYVIFVFCFSFFSVGYEYMMCRMSCKQSCMEQGYWRGVCKQGECFCYGFLGNAFPKMKEALVPML